MAPVAPTGLLDWLDLRAGTAARKIATIYLFTMVSATIVFALTFVAQIDGYKEDQVETLGLVLGLAAEVLLIAGGYIGGTLAYVYGVRVLKREDVSPADAMLPGRAERPTPDPLSGTGLTRIQPDRRAP